MKFGVNPEVTFSSIVNEKTNIMLIKIMIKIAEILWFRFFIMGMLIWSYIKHVEFNYTELWLFITLHSNSVITLDLQIEYDMGYQWLWIP